MAKNQVYTGPTGCPEVSRLKLVAMMVKSRLLFVSICGLVFGSQVANAQRFVNLLPGKDLAGWVKRGGNASYAMEGNELVGSCVLNTP
ncbi:MAG: hypothetical protein WCG75_10045, partial [Armatimonadota bacterium]